MVARPDTELSTVVKMSEKTEWVEPLYFHNKWGNGLMKFFEEVCLDIRDKIQ